MVALRYCNGRTVGKASDNRWPFLENLILEVDRLPAGKSNRKYHSRGSFAEAYLVTSDELAGQRAITVT